MSNKRRNQRRFVVKYFIDNFAKKHSRLMIPNDILYNIIFNYYYIHLWKWDPQLNKKSKFIISDNLMTITSQTSLYDPNHDFGTIFLDDTIINDGYYRFKFKLYGKTRCYNEIAIGVVNIDAFDFNSTGIGDDKSGSWSWYNYGSGGDSEIYMNGSRRMMVPFELYDQNICVLEVNVKNKACNYTICCNDNKRNINVSGMITDLPIKIGVSMNTKYSPLSLQILEQ